MQPHLYLNIVMTYVTQISNFEFTKYTPYLVLVASYGMPLFSISEKPNMFLL